MSDRTGRGRRRLTATEVDFDVVRQRALLVSTGYGMRCAEDADASLAELALLTDTAGADPIEQVLQQRATPDPATYIGRGKVAEVLELAEALDIDVVVFDDELSPAQQRNLEKALGRDVVDRVALILDIFAQHATSGEGMVQVELAQLRYLLPRLHGRGKEMSRLGGGIGTRGPGETQLEVDRRRILRRVAKLERDLVQLGRTRSTQRKSRRRSALMSVALVGYTNAGKSTLLNALTTATVLVEDRLFSTVDPTTRRMRLIGGETILISDTVGFVRKLPHQLVEAFRSTLEEVAGVDLIVHVVDASALDPDSHIAAVHAVLDDIEARDIPELIVWNKMDLAESAEVVRRLHAHPGSVAVSATTGEGLTALSAAIGRRLRALDRVVELVIPYERGDVLATLHREGEVLVEVHVLEGTRVQARLPDETLSRCHAFVIPSTIRR